LTRLLFLLSSLVMLAGILTGQTLAPNQYLSDQDAREYYRLGAELYWAQMQVLESENQALREQAKARAMRDELYDVASQKLRLMLDFQSRIVPEGCTILRERAQIKCPKKGDADEPAKDQGAQRGRQGFHGASPPVDRQSESAPEEAVLDPPQDRGQEDGTPNQPPPVAGDAR